MTREYRVYYQYEDDTRTWCRDITVDDDVEHVDAREELRALADTELFLAAQLTAGFSKTRSEFTAALEIDGGTFKGDAYSETPREVPGGSEPDYNDFPRTHVLNETIGGQQRRRVRIGINPDYSKYVNSAERTLAGRDAGTACGEGYTDAISGTIPAIVVTGEGGPE